MGEHIYLEGADGCNRAYSATLHISSLRSKWLQISEAVEVAAEAVAELAVDVAVDKVLPPVSTVCNDFYLR
jgi:hypothetical protein